MATTLAAVPPALRSVDVNRFAFRGAQVESLKPSIAYWCYYWITQSVLARNLHTEDEETSAYIVALMDKLEKMKAEHPDDPVFQDEEAAKVAIEEFGLRTFLRADDAMRANKSVKQTADTFQAAAVFLDILQIWGPARPDIAQKSKFAKFHALRILKALKAGEDPNAGNPGLESASKKVIYPVEQAAPLHPTIESVVDEDRGPSPIPSMSNNHAAVNANAIPPTAESFYSQPFKPSDGEVSPLEPEKEQPTSEYFPSVAPPPSDLPSGRGEIPQFTDQPPTPVLPDVSPSMNLPSTPTFDTNINSNDLDDTTIVTPMSPPVIIPPTAPQVRTPVVPIQVPRPPKFNPQPFSPPPPVAPNHTVDDEAISKAQKHAKWAISALNFEDVPTAIKELRGALQCLGVGS